MLLPSSASDPATMVAQALSIYNSVSAKAPLLDGGCAAAEFCMETIKSHDVRHRVLACDLAAPLLIWVMPLPDLLWG